MKSYSWTCLLAFVLILSGCGWVNRADKIRPIDLDPTFAFPLAFTSTTLEELLERFDSQALLEVDSTGLIRPWSSTMGQILQVCWTLRFRCSTALASWPSLH